MCLLIFHLVLSGITFNGIDINMAQKVLDWNLARYPNGMSFLATTAPTSLTSGNRCIFLICPGPD